MAVALTMTFSGSAEAWQLGVNGFDGPAPTFAKQLGAKAARVPFWHVNFSTVPPLVPGFHYLMNPMAWRPSLSSYDNACAKTARRWHWPIEVSNEPNHRLFGHYSPHLYAHVFRRCYRAIKRVAPHRRVIMAATSGHSSGSFDYLKSVYRRTKHLHYAMNIHFYPYRGSLSKPILRSSAARDAAVHWYRRVKRRFGRPVWVTEVGASSYDVGLVKQARFLRSMLVGLRNAGAKHIFVHTLFDPPYDPADTFDSGLGLVTTALVPKPSFFAVQAVAP